MTLVFTLGFLCVMMMIMLTLAIVARQERRAASMSSDVISGRLIAQSALDNAIASLKKGAAGNVYPADKFYSPGDSNPWRGRRYVASADKCGDEGIEPALAVVLSGHEFTPDGVLRSSAGWIPVRSRQTMIEDGQTVERDVLLGRYAYVIIDESGKLDPGAVVSSYQDEDSKDRTGRSTTEIPLSAAGVPDASDFRPGEVSVGVAGKMPKEGRWFSMAHVARALDPSDETFAAYCRRLHPYSYDLEKFWRDKNANGVWDKGEDEDRLGLAGSLSLEEIYNTFVGENKLSGDDDCAWLKEVDNQEWFQQWRQALGVSTEAARRLVAAQIATNIIDYSDSNRIPVQAYVDPTGEVNVGSYSGAFNLRGTENNWGISEVSVRIQADQFQPDTETPPGADDGDTLVGIGGSININPNNSPHMEFYLVKPDGTQVNRDDLHKYAPDYQGPSVWVHVKPKGNGNQNGLLVDGVPYSVLNRDTYDITSQQMTVRLYNDRRVNGKAMGHWWIDIVAQNAKIVVNDKGFHGGRIDDAAFEISNGTVIPYEDYIATVTVLGAASSYSTYNCPVTARVTMGSDTYEPWGDADLPLDANLNDGANPRPSRFSQAYPAGEPLSLEAAVWHKRRARDDGTKNSDWEVYRSACSTPENARVLLLQSGDWVPDVRGFRESEGILYYVQDYVHNGKIVLARNQVMAFFEFGDTSADQADYQDLVVLITLDEAAVFAEDVDEAWTDYPMTIWAVTDGSSKLSYVLVDEASVTANVEGVITGIDTTKDIEAFTIDENGVMYFMNNVGTSRLYKILPEDLDRNPGSAVRAIYIGDTGLPAGSTDGEITNLQFVDGVLYGIGKRTKKLYTISVETGAVAEVATLIYDGDFRVEGMTLGADGVVYVVRSDAGGSELWRLPSFPEGIVQKVCNITGSGSVEGLSAHPSGSVYAADGSSLFRVDPGLMTVETVSGYIPATQGMDFYYLGETERVNLGIDPPPGSGSEEDDPISGQGPNLRVRVGARMELFEPFMNNAEDDDPPGRLSITYTAEVATATGKTVEVTRTFNVGLDTANDVGNGTLMFSSDYSDDEWIVIPDAFDLTVEPPLNWYTVTKFQIDRVELRNSVGEVVDTLPAGGGRFCNWEHSGVTYADEEYFVSARCKDVMMNGRPESAPDFGMFWDVSPNTVSLGVGQLEDRSDIGTLTYGTYEDAPYCDVRVKGAVFSRTGELGQVHSFMPLRSLRLWSASSSDTTGHDAAILDVFKIGSASQKRGKVNINTTNRRVLEALFAGASTQSAADVADAILDARANGRVFTNIGDVFAVVPGLSGSDPHNDAAEEAAIAKVAELITVRQNYFTIIACAQAVRDVSGKAYRTYSSESGTPTVVTRNARYFFDTDDSGTPNGMDVVRDAEGKVVSFVDRILAEQKVLAVVYRDGFSNETRVERLEFLTD